LSVLTSGHRRAVEKANNTPTAPAGVWTRRLADLWMAQRLEAGVIWANTYNRSIRLAVRRLQGVGLRREAGGTGSSGIRVRRSGSTGG